VTTVAIDGPAGAGKSTVARELAVRLGWRYVDTGAMYRAVALAALARGVDPGDRAAVEELARAVDVDVTPAAILLDGVEVTDRIRANDVTEAVSRVSAHRGVREVMLAKQREIAARHDVVMEGRDIGATVAPDAAVKIFLTASRPTRALRRARQLGLGFDAHTLGEVEHSLEARDRADATRSASPLTKPPDAVVVDSTEADVATVVDLILKHLWSTVGGG
jgi:cytidylate kinase